MQIVILLIFSADYVNSASFNLKQKITEQTCNDDTKDVKIMASLKYLSNFCRAFKMLLITYEIKICFYGTCYNHFHNILRLFDLMFYQIFLSPQVKRCAIVTYEHDIYELPHELPNVLRNRILGY